MLIPRILGAVCLSAYLLAICVPAVAAYRGHYRRMALKLLFALEFRSNNDRQAGHRHRQELAVACIYEDAVQVPELPLDRGEHRVEVGETADVSANGETSGSKRLFSRLQRPLIQAADRN